MDNFEDTLTNSNKQLNQQKRGRGRPRKNQIVTNTDQSKKKKTLQNKIVEESIILHLPISLEDFHTMKNNVIFDNNDNNTGSSNEVVNNDNIFTINDIDSNSDSLNSSNDTNNIKVYDLKQKVKEQESIIKNLEKEINNYKELLNDPITGINTRKVNKMNINFIDSTTGKKIIIEKTNIACWWCTYNFDTVPCLLPEKFYNDTFYVFGCFCSFECVAHYNLKMDDNAGVWYRYSLLKKLYNTIFNNNSEIALAPPREAFEKFGGPLKYEEYRKNCKNCTKEYRFIMPPMTSIVPLIEEGMKDVTKVNVSLADINKKQRFKRTKPLPHMKNTLLETLGIKEKSFSSGK
jgi:hypothetical protein